MISNNSLSKSKCVSYLQSSNMSHDGRLTVVRLSFDCRSKLLKYITVLALLLTVGVGNAWGTTYTYDFHSCTASSGGAMTYWYSDAGCKTHVSKFTTGTTNQIISSGGTATIYYKDASIPSTAFTISAGNTAYFMAGSSASTSFFLGKTSGNYITLPTYSGEVITKVKVTTSSGVGKSIEVNIYSGTNAASTSYTTTGCTPNGCDNTQYNEFNISSTYQSSALKLQIVTDKKNFQITEIQITTASACTNLGTINGSVNLTQGGNSVTVKDWNEVSNASSYTVKMYKKNGGGTWDLVSGTAASASAGTQGTRTGITNRSTGVTYTGLAVESEYKFTVQAIGDGSSHCDGEETDVTEINSTDVSSIPFKFRYAIYIDNGSNSGWAYHYITPTANANEGSVTIDLNAHVDYYQFKIAGGFSGWWGQTGESKIPANTKWTLNGSNNVKLNTGAGGTYTFTVDYSGTTNPGVTVTFPSADQASGYNIYFDKSIIDGWGSTLKYRIGNGSHNQNQNFTLVPGTDQFYVTTTPSYGSMDAWQIANNVAWSGSYSIYNYYHGDANDITKATIFFDYIVEENITMVPSSKKNTENGCDFWYVDKTSGMLTHNVAVGTAAHGTVVATYTNTSGTTGQIVAEGANADLAHRCIVTITATPDAGYQLSSLTVNGDAFTSGNTHILTADAAIAATFTAQTSTVTLDNNDATSGSQQTVTATYDAAMPLVTTDAGTPAVAALNRTGYTFNGWWDATSGGTQYYSYSGNPAVIASAHAWDKIGAQTLKAQWSINSYTLTWAWGGGSTSAASGEDYTAAGSVAYNTALVYPANNTMSRNGYTFTGWSSDATTMPGNNLTIIAQWTAKQYTVTLDNKGATTSGSTSVTATFDAILPTIIPPTKDGYRFDGYWTEASGGTKYINADGTGATAYKKYSAGEHKLHAHWVAQLTFSVNGAIDDELTRDDNTAMPSTAAVPTACGDCWAFMGWSTNSSESGAPAYAGGATHEFGEPTTLYAVFGKAEYEWISSTSGLVANDYYVLTNIVSSKEYAISNTAHPTYSKDASSTEVTDKIRENAAGYILYNPAANNIWKFTGTKDAGQLQNVGNTSLYLNLTGTGSILSTTDNLTFTLGDYGQWTINSTKYLRHCSANDWDAVSTLTSGDFSCYLYHQISAEYATEPSCETYDIVWKVNGTPLVSGSQTEETNACAGIEELPTDPDDDELDCATKFMGWSEYTLTGTGKSAPADLFTDAADAPAIDADKTFHAVFATTVGTPIAATEDAEFSERDESGKYCNATYSFKATGKYLQKQSIWTSSNMTDVKVRIRVYHVSNSTADVLRVSLINSSGAEVVGADLTTSKLGNNIESAGGWSDVVELTPTSAVTGYKVSMKTSNSYGTGIDKIEREVIASGIKDYVTTCCDELVTLTTNSPANGTIAFVPAGPIATCEANQNVTMTITPSPGYKLSDWSVATGDGKVAAANTTPAVVTGEDNSDEQEITLTFSQHTTGNYDVSATFEQMHDEYFDYMHDNVKVGGNRTGAYSAPSRTSKTAASGEDCKTNHYKFKGWVVSTEINDDGTLKSGYTLITAGTSMTASNKIYYAVWAEEE